MREHATAIPPRRDVCVQDVDSQRKSVQYSNKITSLKVFTTRPLLRDANHVISVSLQDRRPERIAEGYSVTKTANSSVCSWVQRVVRKRDTTSSMLHEDQDVLPGRPPTTRPLIRENPLTDKLDVSRGALGTRLSWSHPSSEHFSWLKKEDWRIPLASASSHNNRTRSRK